MTYRCKCFKNPPLGVLGDSRQIELSSSIFLLRLQFNTLLALGNILGSILYLKIQKYLLKKFPEPLKFDPTWFSTPAGHKLSVKKIWLINFFVSDFVNLWFLVLRNISNNQRPDFVSGILLSWIQCSHRKNWHLFTHSHIYIYIYIYKSASRFSRGTVLNTLKHSRINIMRGKKGFGITFGTADRLNPWRVKRFTKQACREM